MPVPVIGAIGAAGAILAALVLWWDRGMAIILDLGTAIAACF